MQPGATAAEHPSFLGCEKRGFTSPGEQPPLQKQTLAPGLAQSLRHRCWRDGPAASERSAASSTQRSRARRRAGHPRSIAGSWGCWEHRWVPGLGGSGPGSRRGVTASEAPALKPCPSDTSSSTVARKSSRPRAGQLTNRPARAGRAPRS